MAKFLTGVLAGLLAAVLVAVVLIVVAIRLSEAPPQINPQSLLVVDLDGSIVERPPVEVPFFEEKTPLTTFELWRALHEARSDTRIKAVLLMPGNLNAGWGKLEELRSAVAGLAGTAKPVYAFLRSPSGRQYYLATAAQRIFMPPEDLLDLKGLRVELMFFRGTLDKLGVKVEIEHAGKYKDYGDMFTRTSMSPETREVLNSVLDEIYAQLLGAIAEGRKKSVAEARAIVDRGPFLARQALKEGLVDGLRYEDQVIEELKKSVPRLKRVSIRNYIRATAEVRKRGRTRLALVVGEGAIISSEGAGLDGGLAAQEFIKLLRQVGEDGGIRGVIVRVDSPGGESFASDEIWREMNILSKRKPLVISMSDEAASGGYYISMTGDPIVAYPATYTGSIGVVYGKANLRGLYEKLGISKDTLTRGRFAAIDSDYEPLDEAARRKLREGVDDNYRVFVEKVAAARQRKFEEIEPLAQGRVWLGSQAKRNGLVDELGGLDRALELLRQRAGIPRGEQVSIEVYPTRRSLLERLLSRQVRARLPEPLGAFLGRWPTEALGRGGFFRLVPFRLDVR